MMYSTTSSRTRSGMANYLFLKVAPGAGMRVRRDHMTIVCHRSSPDRSSSDTIVVAGTPSHGDVFLLHDLGHPDVLKTDMKVWQHDGGLVHTLAGISHNHVQEPLLSEVITKLIHNSAFPERKDMELPLVDADHKECTHALACLGYLVVVGTELGERAKLLPKALESTSLRSWFELRNPSLVFAPRPWLALEDGTSYDFLVTMLDTGWTWKQLVGFSARKKVRSPLQYRPGDPKIFFSRDDRSKSICKYYLQALLQAEDLSNRTMEGYLICFRMIFSGRHLRILCLVIRLFISIRLQSASRKMS